MRAYLVILATVIGFAAAQPAHAAAAAKAIDISQVASAKASAKTPDATKLAKKKRKRSTKKPASEAAPAK